MGQESDEEEEEEGSKVLAGRNGDNLDLAGMGKVVAGGDSWVAVATGAVEQR